MNVRDVCPACLCEVEKSENCELHCKHSLHLGCAKGLRKLECPVCRGVLEGDNLTESIIETIKTHIEIDEKETKQDSLRRTEELIQNLLREQINVAIDPDILSLFGNLTMSLMSHPDLNYLVTIFEDLNWDRKCCKHVLKEFMRLENL